MKTSRAIVVALAIVLATLNFAVAQQSAETPPAGRGLVLEVTYFKGRPMTYQRPGEWTWYEMFQTPTGWKPRAGETPVAAVKLAVKLDAGVIKVRVTVLRGRNHETEDFVAEYLPTVDKKVAIRELSDLGVEPFELQLVRAPSTVAEPPGVVNKTRSLEVSVEPTQSTLPTFRARFLNNSAKAVAALFMYTSVDGVRKLSGIQSNDAGGALIKSGEVFERLIKYPMQSSTTSTGEVPSAVGNLILNVTAVVFTDGSYEGDELAAASYLAANFAEKEQLRKILEYIGSRGTASTQEMFAVPGAHADVDGMTAEFVQRFPALSADEKTNLRRTIDFGKSRGVKFFSKLSGEPAATWSERLQSRIAALP